MLTVPILSRLQSESIEKIQSAHSLEQLENTRTDLLGRKGAINKLVKTITTAPPDERKSLGIEINTLKNTIQSEIEKRKRELTIQSKTSLDTFYDVTKPGIQPPSGHLHLITQAIEEISAIFSQIGFSLISYPEIEYDWFAFESLNMPSGHAARDEWETFFINLPAHKKYGDVVLTPHTSNGQVRELLRLKEPPIRMINIGKTYRRQTDISHSPMFHQFEGFAVDKGLGIGDLKGIMEYFVKEYYGKERKIRLRPYHFNFTEPSFEIDINCDICQGSGCRLCKEGWLELGGSGMTHPTVLKNGGIDPEKYTGIAFGWGIERVLMMKQGMNIPDLRLLYGTDIRFLEQF